MPFASVPEQPDAIRLLEAALADDPAHAFLFHGPAGVGKRAAALAFAAALLGDARRVEGRSHPDLRVLEALGDMIRIDAIRELHHDLHMRPFEADRRVYLLFDAQLLNPDAADALLEGPRGAAARTRRSCSSPTSSARSRTRSAPAVSWCRSVGCPSGQSCAGSPRALQRSARPRPWPSRGSPPGGSTEPSGSSILQRACAARP